MKKFSIYLHFPFCLKKCNYCDFLSFPCPFEIEDLTDYYLKELDLYFHKFGKRSVPSIYFGGGTPSLMKPVWVERILKKIYDLFDVIDNVEITLEVNPKTVDEKKLYEFFRAGVNRLSVGIQSFDDEELAFLGRVHNSLDAFHILDMANKYFKNINADFIYALPNQSFEKWQNNLEKIKALSLPHLSLYQLIIEPKTYLYSLCKKGKLKPICEDIALKMFKYTNSYLKSSFSHYEVSNYAQKGFESFHNLNYWNGGDYIGIGLGAVGRILEGNHIFAVENPKNIVDWKLNIDRGCLPIKTLTKKSRARELLIMGLRKKSGINLCEFKKNSLCDFNDIVDNVKLKKLLDEKFLIYSNNHIRLSVKGFYLLDAIIREIIK